MSEQPVPERNGARRRELLDAVDRIVREQGPDASMEALAAGAGITKPVLYRHFGSKEGLYGALAERYVAPLLRTMRAELHRPVDRRTRTRATIAAYLSFIDSHRQEYRFLMDRVVVEGGRPHVTVADFTRQIAEEVADALARDLGRDRPSAELRAWAHGIVGMVHLAGDWWLHEEALTREALVDELTSLAWDGLAAVEPEAG